MKGIRFIPLEMSFKMSAFFQSVIRVGSIFQKGFTGRRITNSGIME